ncbi:MAG: hypothetical protein GEEBNDBF_01453 [bacterium]|nr:hypothetical protein [bacterium]
MRASLWWLAGTSLLAALGCSSGSSNPLQPGTIPSAEGLAPASVTASGSLGTPVITGGTATSALAIYTIDVDPATLQATSRLKETRRVQANDDLYLLSIDNFLRPDSFRVTGITSTATTVDVEYLVEHPFPAPNNPSGAPNGSTNRADLSITGMVLFVVDAPASGNTYFTDRVANTSTVANPNAYYSPGGLISTTGTANTFPYRLLVDEQADARIGVSNGGDVTGNFGSDGWTRSEFGANNDGWTGFGFLHGGQKAQNTLSLNKSALGGGFSLDAAVIAKYPDPRGGINATQKRANRLPPASPDASLFAYRMPHGALDVASIAVLPFDGAFGPNAVSAMDLRFHVVDWDARATETTESDLSLDASFTNVSQGESGAPTLAVCIPGVLGNASFTDDWDTGSTLQDDDSAYGGDAAQDSGRPGDALYYGKTVTKAAGSGQSAGIYTGMVRATDPETGLVVGLDGSLTPLTVTPLPVTYQSFTVTMGTVNLPPSAAYATTTASISSGNSVTINVTSVADPDADPVEVFVDWSNTGTFVSAGTINSPYPANNNFTSPITYTFSGSAPDTRTVPCRISDGVNPPVNLLPSATFTVNPPGTRCPSPVPAKTATDISAPWPTDVTDLAAWALPVDATGATWPAAWGGNPSNYAAFRGATLAGASAGWLGQFRGTSTISPNLFFEFVRLIPGVDVTDPPLVQIISNLDTNPTGTLFNRQVSDIEVDSNNRVIFTRRNAGSFSISGSPLVAYSGNTAEILWFDFDGVTLVTDASINIITTAAPLVAIALDKDNNIWGIDTQQVLRFYEKTGATTYAENTTAPFPLDLKLPPISLPPNTGTGAANHKVSELAIDDYNGAFYILEENGVAAGANPGDGRVYRVECDGTFSASLNGNPNPSAPLNITDSSVQGIGSDIFIDNLNASGGQLGAQSDVQIIVLGQNTQAGVWDDEYIMNSELVVTNGSDFVGASGIKGAISQNNNTFCRSNGTAGTFRLYWTPPAGWQ